jgi:hypothetical protein
VRDGETRGDQETAEPIPVRVCIVNRLRCPPGVCVGVVISRRILELDAESRIRVGPPVGHARTENCVYSQAATCAVSADNLALDKEKRIKLSVSPLRKISLVAKPWTQWVPACRALSVH